MALDQKPQSPVASILGRFKQGVLMDDEAYKYSEPEIGVEGINLIRQSLKELDSLGPHARDALIPLLDDPSTAIRAWTAAALIKIIPERALSILYEIRDRSLSDSRMTASHLLILHEQGKLIC